MNLFPITVNGEISRNFIQEQDTRYFTIPQQHAITNKNEVRS